jgi:hypothetical protein
MNLEQIRSTIQLHMSCNSEDTGILYENFVGIFNLFAGERKKRKKKESK